MRYETTGPRPRLADFRGEGYEKGRNRAWQVAWLTFDSLLFRRWWFSARARAAFLRWFGASIGANVLVRHDVRIHWPWKLTIGDNSWVGVGAWLLNLEPVIIGSDSCISQGVMLCTGSHDYASATFEFDNAPIVVGSGVWIGARATVLRGVTVGDDSVVGACALVVNDVPPRSKVLAPRAQGH